MGRTPRFVSEKLLVFHSILFCLLYQIYISVELISINKACHIAAGSLCCGTIWKMHIPIQYLDLHSATLLQYIEVMVLKARFRSAHICLCIPVKVHKTFMYSSACWAFSSYNQIRKGRGKQSCMADYYHRFNLLQFLTVFNERNWVSTCAVLDKCNPIFPPGGLSVREISF